MKIRLHLRNNLPNIKCKEYLSWVADNFPKHLEGHHLLGQKYCDLLIAKLPYKIHHSNAINTDFCEHYSLAIDTLGKYARYTKKPFEGASYYDLNNEFLIERLIALFDRLIACQTTLQSNDETLFDISEYE